MSYILGPRGGEATAKGKTLCVVRRSNDRVPAMSELYPEIEPFDSDYLQVSPEHDMYYEQSGNPEGKPVLYIHGGPGAGASPKSRRFFDPEHYRIILFDQRGSGKSKPHASLENNTTWELVKDIELLRKHLGIRKFLLFGGSWGSTLALTYAINHPSHVMGLILRGIFLCRQSEIEWFYQYGAHHIFPDVWESYLEPIPENERNDLVSAYYKRLTSEDDSERMKAAFAWSKWEAACARLIQDPDKIAEFDDPELAEAFARIECHYFTNKVFFESDNYLLENVEKIRHLPGLIVHGRYDIVCPVRSAWDLHKAWPESQLKIIPDAGHAASEPPIESALVSACEAFKEIKFQP